MKIWKNTETLFLVTEYAQVSGDSEDEVDRIQSSRSDSALSLGGSSSAISINCETQTLPVDELTDRDDAMELKASTPNAEARSATSWDKFRLLMWKNGLLQWRHKWQMAIEIIVPVLFSALMVMIRSLVTPDLIANATLYNSFEINSLDSLR